MTLEEQVAFIIKQSEDNTAGDIVDELHISVILRKCRKGISPESVDELINEYLTDRGYLVKARDFIHALNTF